MCIVKVTGTNGHLKLGPQGLVLDLLVDGPGWIKDDTQSR